MRILLNTEQLRQFDEALGVLNSQLRAEDSLNGKISSRERFVEKVLTMINADNMSSFIAKKIDIFRFDRAMAEEEFERGLDRMGGIW